MSVTGGTVMDSLEEIYEIIEDFNTRMEEAIEECTDTEAIELAIPHLSQRIEEFMYDFQITLDKLKMDPVQS